MKSLHLLLVLVAFSSATTLSHAEIYKWKDKNGAIRYTDTPPPSNIKQEAIGKKKAVQSTVQAPLAGSVEPTKEVPKESMNKEDDAAKQRQRNAEAEKRNKLEKEAEAKRKAENCKAAKANFETYKQGGRVYKMNEKGEREYLDDKGLNEGKAKAQSEIDENCS